MIRLQAFFFTQRRNITRLLGNTVIKTSFVGMSRIKDHHPIVRKYQKRWVVMVIRLKPGTYQYLHLFVLYKIVLHRFDITMHINITDVCFSDFLLRVFLMNSSWIRKPTPSTFWTYLIAYLYLCKQRKYERT